MKRQIRNGVFETNSSATHAITIYFSDKFSACTYIEDYEDGEFPDYICFSEQEVEDLMESIPTEMLEKELEKRKNKLNNE